MALFTPDIVASDDRVGFGHWLNAHYYEHKQFITIGLQQTPPIKFVDYDLLAWDEQYPESKKAWLNVHESMHESLRGVLNIRSVDLSEVDTDNPEAFQIWQNVHATEHALLRQSLGGS